jgi:hypothetical protein
MESKTSAGKKIGLGLLGGCGASLVAFVVITLCVAVAFPVLVLASGDSYAESQFFLNTVLPPICGGLAALAAGVMGFVVVYRRVK